MNGKKQRNIYFDFLKGSVICLVVMGHSIQFGSGAIYLENEYFFEDFLFRMIYCFHMPIFMMVSGFFFSFSVRKCGFRQLIKKQITHLLMPVVLWGTVDYILSAIISNSMYFSLEKWCHDVLFGLWFLWAIFYSSIVIAFVKQFCGDRIFVYVIGWLVTFLLPDNYNFSLYKFMYPFFVVSYFVGKNYDFFIEKFKEKVILSVVISGIITGILFPFFHYDAYVYTSGYCIWGNGNPMRQVAIDIYRMLIGFSGSIFWGSLMYFIYKKINAGSVVCMLLSNLGYRAIGIYILSGYVFQYGLKVFTPNFTPNYIFNLFEAGIILMLCTAGTEVMMRFRLVNRFFLGGKG